MHVRVLAVARAVELRALRQPSAELGGARLYRKVSGSSSSSRRRWRSGPAALRLRYADGERPAGPVDTDGDIMGRMTTPTTAQVRAWARAQGYAVADRGRLPASVVAAYAAAHPTEAPPPAEPPPEVATQPAVDVTEPATKPAVDVTGRPVLHDPFAAPAAAATAFGAEAQPPVPPPLPQQPRGRTSTDGPSMAALIVSTVPPLALVGIVLGIVGLVRTGRSGRPGRDLALSGIVVGAFWLVALLGIGAAVYALDEPPERAGEGGGVVTAGDVLLEDLQPGDCVRRLPAGAVRTLEAVPCGEPHRAEVYAVFDLTAPPGGTYPGDEEVRRVTDGGCDRRSTELGLPAKGLAAVSFSPDEDTWGLGDREVICLLEAPDGLTGPLPRGGGAEPVPA